MSVTVHQRPPARDRRALCVLCGLALLLPALARGAGAAVPEVRDLQTLAHVAAARGVPILLEFAASDCRYCRLLERDVLVPMRISGDYRNKALIRKIEIDGGATVRDFRGRVVPVATLAHRYRVEITPVVVLLDPTGRELVPRLVGIANPDFYPGELDDAINRAGRRLRGAAGAAAPAGGGG